MNESHLKHEIERKFLVKGDGFKGESTNSYRIMQGYLSSSTERTVRIRIKGHSGYITIKGASDPTGVSRPEWEKEIPLPEAEELLKLCEPGIIDKIRYEVKFDRHIFEIDVFQGSNDGLILAEVELEEKDELFQKPEWLGEEVTGDPRYYNSMLSKSPYYLW